MKLIAWLRALPRYTIPLMAATWLWQGIAFYLPKALMDGKRHFDLTIAADRYVPFLPWTSVIYLLGFAFWIATYLYCSAQEKERAYRFLCAEFLAKCVCLLFFLLLPTAIVRPSVEGNSLGEQLIRFIYWFDSPTNLFPSIHCLMSWFCYLGVRDAPNATRGAKLGVLALAVAVCLSALTTGQHVVVDLFGGIALAELCYWLAARPRILWAYTDVADRIVGACLYFTRSRRF